MNYYNQLQRILRATKWSQAELAQRLDVSQVTANFWLNRRSVPRKNKQRAIEGLYVNILGSNEVDQARLDQKRAARTALPSVSAADIITNKPLLDTLTLHLTYHTNTIEGSTMTVEDVKEVLFDNKVLTNRTAIEQLEARNHQAALHWLLNKIAQEGQAFTVDEATLRGIHQRLMNGIASDAGIYRRHSVRIMGSSVTLANWVSIPERIASMIGSGVLQSSDSAILAKTHAEFEQIHPFSDGNGRTGRLLMLAQALADNTFPPLVERERKYAYYKYLERAQTKADTDPLELFLIESIEYAARLLTKRAA